VNLPGRALAVALLAVAMLAAPMWGQPQSLIVSTGVGDGTYAAFFSQFSRVCTQPPLQGRPSTGSIENLDRLLNNEANLAFVQADVLVTKLLIDHDLRVQSVRTFMLLYYEEIHILAKASNASIANFSDLSNKKVGVYGGSTTTASALFTSTGIQPARLETFPGPTEAARALGGEVDAVLGVGGKPLPWVAALDSSYKLIAFDMFDKLSRISKIYSQTTLGYPNLAKPPEVQTVAVPSLLITMGYTAPAIVTPLLQLRTCIIKNLGVLRDTPGNHPKWRDIDPSIKGPWPYFEEPKSS